MNFSVNDLAGLLGGGGNEAAGGGGIMQLLSQIFGGGAGGAASGGISKGALLGLLGGGGSAGAGLQGVSGHQQVWTPGGQTINPNASPPDFPAANMNDPFGGIRGEISPGDYNTSPFGLANVFNFGTNPSGGGAFGPTQLPTFWTNYSGVGNVPFAVPNTPGGWTPSPGDDLGRTHMPMSNV